MVEVDQWLVRTAQNLIMGPYKREEVLDLIREGALSLQDEVCQANHYWFYLHEHEELKRQLGLEMPQQRPADDDVTLTQTETQRVPEPAPGAAAYDQGDAPDQTAIFSRQSGGQSSMATAQQQQQSQPQRVPPKVHIPKFEKVFVVGQMERVSFWRGVAWALFTMIVVLLAILIALLRMS